MIKIIVSIIITNMLSIFKQLWNEYKLKKLNDKIEEKTKEVNNEVEKADRAYYDFISDYSEYGKSRLRQDSGEVQHSSGTAEKGDRVTKGTDSK